MRSLREGTKFKRNIPKIPQSSNMVSADLIRTQTRIKESLILIDNGIFPSIKEGFVGMLCEVSLKEVLEPEMHNLCLSSNS